MNTPSRTRRPSPLPARRAAACVLTAVAVVGAGLVLPHRAGAVATGLVAAYAFDEGAGTAVTDSSGAANNGTLSGATWVTGRSGRALSFSGTGKVVVVDSNSLDLTSGMTVEAWVRPASTTNWQPVVMKEDTNDWAWSLYAVSGANGAATKVQNSTGTGFTARNTTKLPVGTWVHLATTYDGSALRLYQDAQLVATKTMSGNLKATAGRLLIGNDTWGQGLSGVVDDVRVYNRALGASEIAADRTTPVSTTGTTTTTSTTASTTTTVKPTSTTTSTTTTVAPSTTTSSTTTTTSTTTTVAPSTTTTSTTSTTVPTSTGWWRPTSAAPSKLHWVLGGALDLVDPVQMGLRDLNGNTLPAPDVYDIDGEFNTAATVAALHAQGKRVICYFDAGVYEDYRSDAWKFPASVIGAKDGNWAGSYWLDIRQVSVLEPIMKARMQMCKDKGFDAIEPDEIDGYENNSGFPLTYADQLTYNRALASWAHAIGMSIGQKGDLIQVKDLYTSFDWTLNEECFQYSECDAVYDPTTGKTTPGLSYYAKANKAVWVAEYQNYSSTQWNSICSTSNTQHWNTARYKLGLPNNGGRQPCPGGW